MSVSSTASAVRSAQTPLRCLSEAEGNIWKIKRGTPVYR